MKRAFLTFVAAIMAVAVCVSLGACGEVDYSVAGKTYEYSDAKYELAENTPEYIVDALNRTMTTVGATMKGKYSFSFDKRGKCKVETMGQTAEFSYKQDGKTVTIAGGGGTDGMVCTLNDGETALTYSAPITAEMKQMLSVMADYIISMSSTYTLKA